MKQKDYTIENKYIHAKQQVEKIKGFYIHFAIYLIINSGITILKVYKNMENGETFSESIFDFATFAIWAFWGIGVAAHAIGVFGFPFLLGKNWEEKKIAEFMQKEEEEFKKIE